MESQYRTIWAVGGLVDRQHHEAGEVREQRHHHGRRQTVRRADTQHSIQPIDLTNFDDVDFLHWCERRATPGWTVWRRQPLRSISRRLQMH